MVGYRYNVSFDCGDLGKRVTVRYRSSDGQPTDVVGILEHCDEGQIAVRDKRAQLVYVARGDVMAGKVIPSPAWDDQDQSWGGDLPRNIAPG
jgi:hypothetical protein